jgi:Sigma-70 region 2
MTDRERLLDELRPVAFAIAFRMLGSISEAEDVMREALLRVHQTLQAGEQIASPRAFVATVTTRLDQSRAARDELAARFFAAAEHGDLAGLEAPLTSDVELTGDGGLDAQQRLISVFALEIAGGQITSIHGIVNSDKLTHLGPLADHTSLPSTPASTSPPCTTSSPSASTRIRS